MKNLLLCFTVLTCLPTALLASQHQPSGDTQPQRTESLSTEPPSREALRTDLASAQLPVHFIAPTRRFAIELPDGWRQMSPAEARSLRSQLPESAQTTQPRDFYVLGPVAKWLESGFDGVFLQVIEQGEEWAMDSTVADRVKEHWRQVPGEHQIVEARLVALGRVSNPGGIEAGELTPTPESLVCVRESQAPGDEPIKALEAYVPTGGRQLILSCQCPGPDLAQHRPQFERILGSLALARGSRGAATLGNKLWTPWLWGAGVFIALLILRRVAQKRVAP